MMQHLSKDNAQNTGPLQNMVLHTANKLPNFEGHSVFLSYYIKTTQQQAITLRYNIHTNQKLWTDETFQMI